MRQTNLSFAILVGKSLRTYSGLLNIRYPILRYEVRFKAACFCFLTIISSLCQNIAITIAATMASTGLISHVELIRPKLATHPLSSRRTRLGSNAPGWSCLVGQESPHLTYSAEMLQGWSRSKQGHEKLLGVLAIWKCPVYFKEFTFV